MCEYKGGALKRGWSGRKVRNRKQAIAIGFSGTRRGGARVSREWFLSAARAPSNRLVKKLIMLITVAVILIILWLLGLVSSYTLGGFIYILLAAAIVLILIRLIQGKNPV